MRVGDIGKRMSLVKIVAIAEGLAQWGPVIGP